ncbi:MAG: hypothetical protein KJ971_08630 [Firmicutes bacterium]|nr:hypothetical protein [Bacillota bacterium]
MKLEIIQYMMPDGRKVPNSLTIPDELGEKVAKIKEAGYVFCCEMLQTGHVALYVSDDVNGVDVGTEIAENRECENKPVNALIRMIKEFDFDEAKEMIQELG